MVGEAYSSELDSSDVDFLYYAWHGESDTTLHGAPQVSATLVVYDTSKVVALRKALADARLQYKAQPPDVKLHQQTIREIQRPSFWEVLKLASVIVVGILGLGLVVFGAFKLRPG